MRRRLLAVAGLGALLALVWWLWPAPAEHTWEQARSGPVRWVEPPVAPVPARTADVPSAAASFLEEAAQRLEAQCAAPPCHACVPSPYGGSYCRELWEREDGTLGSSEGGRGMTLAYLAQRDPEIYRSYAQCLPFHDLPGVRCHIEGDGSGTTLITSLAGRRLVLRSFAVATE